MRNALIGVWSSGKFQSERGEWPRDIWISQKRYLGWIMKGTLEITGRSGAWLKLRLHGAGEQLEKRLKNRRWGSYKSTERARRHVMMTQNITESRQDVFDRHGSGVIIRNW